MSRLLFVLLLLTLIFMTTIEPYQNQGLVRSFPADEARQGVAVGQGFVWVIDNSTIGKYTESGQKLDGTIVPLHIKHLNGGVVVGDKLYCTNNPMDLKRANVDPTINSIEVFQTHPALTLISTIKPNTKLFPDLDYGSLTWIDFYQDAWYGTYAFYKDQVARTRLVKFNPDWSINRTWVYPLSLTQKWFPYSCSGGSFKNDKLYVTGHDKQFLYVLQLINDTLQFIKEIPIIGEGQGISWDNTGLLYTISRSKKMVNIESIPS